MQRPKRNSPKFLWRVNSDMNISQGGVAKHLEFLESWQGWCGSDIGGKVIPETACSDSECTLASRCNQLIRRIIVTCPLKGKGKTSGT